MNWYRPKIKDTDKRRKLVEDIIRTRQIKTAPHLLDILSMEYNIDVTEETIRRDLLHLNAVKDANTQTYVLLDSLLTRFDLYLMLRHACVFLLNDLKINSRGDMVFLYPDIGTGDRFQYFLEAIRQDEEITADRSWHDHILATVSSGDVVIVYFPDGNAGRKFYSKLRVLGKQDTDLSFASNLDEENMLRKVMDDEVS